MKDQEDALKIIQLAESIAFEEGYQKGRSETIGKYFEATIKNYELGFASGVNMLKDRLQTLIECDCKFDPSNRDLLISKINHCAEELKKGEIYEK